MVQKPGNKFELNRNWQLLITSHTSSIRIRICFCELNRL